MPPKFKCSECGRVHDGGHNEKACALTAEQREDKTARAETDEDNPGSPY